jgi:hypothetical protein
MGGDKGATFTLGARLETDETDAALIDRFKLHDQPMTTQVVNGVEITGLTVGALIHGADSRFGSLDGLMEFEQVLVSGFHQLNALLEYADAFDSERVVGPSGTPAVLS